MHLFFFFLILFIYLFFTYDCVGSSFPREGSLQLRQAGATLHRGARAPHHHGLPHCGEQAPDAQAQQPWLTGPIALRHAGSSQIRARTRVPCISRQTPNYCATREAPYWLFKLISLCVRVCVCVCVCVWVFPLGFQCALLLIILLHINYKTLETMYFHLFSTEFGVVSYEIHLHIL